MYKMKLIYCAVAIFFSIASTNVFCAVKSESYYDQLGQLQAISNIDCQDIELYPLQDCKEQSISYKGYISSTYIPNIPKENDGFLKYTIAGLGYLANGNTQDIYDVVYYIDRSGAAQAEERFEILEFKDDKLKSKFGLMEYTDFKKAIKKLKITLQVKYGNPKGFDENW